MTSVLSTLVDHTHHSSQSLIFKGEHCFQRDLVFSRVKQTTVRAKENRGRGSKAKCQSFTLINTPIETTDKDLGSSTGFRGTIHARSDLAVSANYRRVREREVCLECCAVTS